MLKLEKVIRIVILSAVVSFVFISQAAHADDYEPFKSLIDKYQNGDSKTKKEVVKKLGRNEPKTQEDMEQIRKIFLKKDFKEGLFLAGSDAVIMVKDPSLDSELIGVLEDEKPLMEKVSKKDYAGKPVLELKHRGINVMFIIEKLGNLKSQKAVPVLKDYLKMTSFQYYASQALANIGDKSASEEIRERAYKGEEVIYGGQGLDEAIRVVQDLEDKGKKDKWNKIAGQLKSINTPDAKPYLKRLFNHEQNYVRDDAARVFSRLASDNDKDDLIEMTINTDHRIRYHGMMGILQRKGLVVDDEIFIQILTNDREWLCRSTAARALGYKKVQRAVPYLEKALKDKEVFVRVEAFIALYVLTGNKYDFDGRNKSVDRDAEVQAERPSIY